MTYGKHFKSLYEGSMVGAGAIVFAVWGYVIANADPHREWGMVVRLNAKLLGPILGESPKEVEKAIEFLCAPDEESNSKECEGRRMIRQGQFEYQVVNGARYMAIRNEEDRKRQLREAQARFRAKQRGSEAVAAVEPAASDEDCKNEVKKRERKGKVWNESVGKKVDVGSVADPAFVDGGDEDSMANRAAREMRKKLGVEEPKWAPGVETPEEEIGPEQVEAGEELVAARKEAALKKADKVLSAHNAMHPRRADREAAAAGEIAEIEARMARGEPAPDYPADRVGDELKAGRDEDVGAEI